MSFFFPSSFSVCSSISFFHLGSSASVNQQCVSVCVCVCVCVCVFLFPLKQQCLSESTHLFQRLNRHCSTREPWDREQAFFMPGSVHPVGPEQCIIYVYIYVYEAIHKIQDLSFGNSGVPTIINMQWKGKSQWLPAHIGHLSFFWKASTVAWEQYTVVETKLWLLHAWWDGLPWAVSIAPCTVFSPVPNGMCSSSVPIRCSLNTKITSQILKCVLHPCSI